MGKGHSWKDGIDMGLVRRLVKAARTQSGAFTDNNEGLPTDKDICRAIKTGKALYTPDSIMIMHQQAEPIQIQDYKGDTLQTTKASVLISDLAGPQSRELLAKLKAHLAGMPEGRRPNIYSRVFLGDQEQQKLMEGIGLAHLATSIAPNGAVVGTYGPRSQASIDHEDEDLVAAKLIKADHITQETQAQILAIQETQPKRMPKSVKQAMKGIPGKAMENFGFSVEPGETTKKGGRLNARKRIVNGQIVVFLIPLEIGPDSRTWLHTKDNTGKEVKIQLQERGLYYVDPRRPWTITNHSNAKNWIMCVTVKGDKAVAKTINK